MQLELTNQHVFKVSKSNLKMFVEQLNKKADGWKASIAWAFEDYSIYSSPDKNYITLIVNEYGFYPFMIDELYKFYDKIKPKGE